MSAEDLHNLYLKDLKKLAVECGINSSGNKKVVIAKLLELPDDVLDEKLSVFVTNELDASNNDINISLREDESGEKIEFQNTPTAHTHTKTMTAASAAEMDLLRRENIMMAKELDLLKREMEIKLAYKEQPKQLTNELKVIKNYIADFNDDDDGAIWLRNLRSIQTKFNADDETIRALFAQKLQGKAKQWYVCQSDTVSARVDDLFDRFSAVFSNTQTKLVRRRKAEARAWNYDETFYAYYVDKMLLLQKAEINDNEFIDLIIEGIPDKQLKINASMQHFASQEDLLKVMSSMKLEKPSPIIEKPNKQIHRPVPSTTKCFNCNSMGHIAANCRKPKREKGTCYACGSADHQIANCSENKHKPTTNEYVHKFLIKSKQTHDINLILDCQIDSGSPISFIKRQYVPATTELNELQNTIKYYGLNKSKLSCEGTIDCSISHNNNTTDIRLLVVPDISMNSPVVLGRDFLKRANARVTFSDNDLPTNIEEIEVEIMNIEVEESKVEDSLILGDSISLNHRETLKSLITNKYLKAVRPTVPNTSYLMKLNLMDHKPFNCPPRRISYAEKQELQKVIDDYKAKGIIRSSESEYASPIVLVRKKTGEIRLCVDYRRLNKITAKQNYPIPLIDDLLERLSKKNYFTKLDLKDAFFHVSMHDDSIKYTAFTTPLGQFEFLKMPFGLTNSPQIFQRFINKIFEDLINNGKIIIYLDDLMIATDNIKDHLQILEEVLNKLVANKLQLRLDKCKFLQHEIDYLGYIINSSGVRANDKGLEAIKHFPTPSNLVSVQSFLGLCSYFRRFIKDFSLMAKPLHDLSKKNKEFKFGDEERKSFELLKKKLTEAPVLALFDNNSDTELHCDASSIGFGAILLQKDKDSKWHPVFYFSKRTTEAESKFHSYELETLAIVYALRRFRVYLQGRPFKIITDCNSLTMCLNKKELNPRIARWALEFQNFDYSVEHRPGTKMQHVDSLSRCTDNEVLVIDNITFEDNLIICQSRDPQLIKIRSELETNNSDSYKMENGVIYKKKGESLLFYVPEAMENHILYKYHNEMGHMGINKVIDLIGKTYWFPQIRGKVEDHINNCLQCISYSAKSGKAEGEIHNIPKSNVPFQTIHIDHYGPVDRNTSKKYLLVVIDSCTKFVKLYATKTTNTKEVITSLKEYFRYYSRPKCIISDRGSSFTSNEFNSFLSDNNIKHIKIATGSPQANGQVERVNRNLGPMIAKLSSNECTWNKTIELVELSLNNTIHRMINAHPSIMLFGVNQRGNVIDKIREELEENECVSLEKVRDTARQHEEAAQDYNRTYVNRKRKTKTNYKIGDYIMLKNFNSTMGGATKLIPKFKGPYKITKILKNDRFLVEDVDGFQQTQIPYKGIWSVNNIKPWLRRSVKYNLRNRL